MNPSAVRGAVALLFALVIVGAGFVATPTVAVGDQEGRQSASHAVDGSYSRLEGNGFSANYGQCVIYSTLSADWTNHKMVQAGVVRCNHAVLDRYTGACHGGHAFVEVENKTGYHCDQGYSITNNTLYDATTYRISATGAKFHGHINGAHHNVGSMGLHHDIRAYAWGEATGVNSQCPAPAKGTFTRWKRYNTANGWHLISNSSRWRQNHGMNRHCWRTISDVNSGTFHVD